MLCRRTFLDSAADKEESERDGRDANRRGHLSELLSGDGDPTLSEPRGNSGNADGTSHKSKSKRTMRWRAARVTAKWQSRGWDLVAQSQGPLRTTMVFQRPRVTRRRRVWVATAATVALVLALGGFAAVKLAPSKVAPALDRIPGVTLDSDHDGIPDQRETAGWRTQTGANYRTDPNNQDSDGDGLSDGDEAGPLLQNKDGTTTYAGRSDPNKADTDNDGLTDAVEIGDITAGVSARSDTYLVSDPLTADTDIDGIGDGDEYFLDMDPLAPDTDDDGLPDGQELDFGSDPTLANPDEDSYTDKEEYEHESNPLSYDLNGDEKVAAGKAGLKYGDCDECALDAGLRVEQIESAEYLAGHVVSGIAVYGDIRDLAFNLWKHKFIAAGLASLGLIPYIGDSTKAAAQLTKFARRGDRAEQAVRDVTDKLPLSASLKKKILDGLPSQAGKLPSELAGGPKNYVVYTGANYVGITNDFPRRLAQHARAGRSFIPEPMPGATGLARGEAQAIEQACIDQGGLATSGGLLENRINSIDPKRNYKETAVAFGLAFLKKIGGICPVTALP